MLKSYEELRKINVSPYCEKRDGYLYLNWARCIDLLHKNGAETVYFVPIPNQNTGGSLIESESTFTNKNGVTNRCYETRIRVVIDDKEYVMQSPVMNGTTPVLDNSMNQQRVWNSMTRSFVKCVAINTGLGFDLWLKEEEKVLEYLPSSDTDLATEAEKKAIQKACKEHGISYAKWLQKAGTTDEKLTGIEAGKMLRAINEVYGEKV